MKNIKTCVTETECEKYQKHENDKKKFKRSRIKKLSRTW